MNQVSEQPEPLWATSLAHQPQREDLFAEAPVEEPARPDEQQRGGLLTAAVAITVVAVVAFTASIATVGRGSLTVMDVPSYWGDIPMTCHTTRLDEEDGAVELFSCRATGFDELPPGVYRSPESQWTSDITRIDARSSTIVISPDGELNGWAVY